MSIERRACPRYALSCPLKVRLPAEEFTATTLTLSRNSIQLTCKEALVKSLLRQSRLPYTCELELKFPLDSSPRVLQAHLLTQRRLSQQDYVMVLLLRHQDDDGLLLQQTLESLAAKQDA